MPHTDPRHIDGRQLPQYRCHKTVGALQIAEVNGFELKFIDTRFHAVLCDETMFSRYKPKPGDFYIIYEDGYKSFSPRQAFLDGYTLSPEGKERHAE